MPDGLNNGSRDDAGKLLSNMKSYIELQMHFAQIIQSVAFLFNKANACCGKVVLGGNNELKKLHGDKLGIYENIMVAGNDHVYKLSGGEYYIHRSPSMHWTVRFL